MKKTQKNFEAIQLINLIHAETKKRGWTLRDTANELGISHIYMTSITSGARKIGRLNIEKQRLLSRFLGISMVEFFIKGGILRPEDFPEGIVV